jgi:hypothetical protein
MDAPGGYENEAMASLVYLNKSWYKLRWPLAVTAAEAFIVETRQGEPA